jgi:hypothetical protein
MKFIGIIYATREGHTAKIAARIASGLHALGFTAGFSAGSSTGAAFAFVQAGEELDLVADFGVGGEVGGFDPATAKAFGGFALGGVVLGLDPLIHQAGGLVGDSVAEFVIGHPRNAPILEAHSCGAGLMF